MATMESLDNESEQNRIDWEHFQTNAGRMVGRIPILLLLSISVFLGLASLGESNPAGLAEVHRSLQIVSINDRSLDIITLLFILTAAWVIYPGVRALEAFEPKVRQWRDE